MKHTIPQKMSVFNGKYLNLNNSAYCFLIKFPFSTGFLDYFDSFAAYSLCFYQLKRKDLLN